MSENKTLSAAKSVNNDEFYTQYNDIDDAESLYEQRSLVTNIVNSPVASHATLTAVRS